MEEQYTWMMAPTLEHVLAAHDQKTECFFQVLAVHGQNDDKLRTQSIYFSP